ncbi:MAG TPA: potassium-transporting ATPase subunit B, partial [Acidimicrobiales bacterium]|nr:potassium-transporting ATPase subunit B [Acidimicrobiales bacterium]
MTITTGSPAPPAPVPHGVAQARGLFDREILIQATTDAFKKLDPRVQVGNPVMFVVLVGTVVTFIEAVAHPGIFTCSITIWLFLTVVFANFAEAMAEGRGKAQAETLRRMRADTSARRLPPGGDEERVPASALVKGDLVVCEAGDVVPSDGD